MATILLVAAVILALIGALLGFDVFATDGDPRVLAWLSLAVAAFAASFLPNDR